MKKSKNLLAFACFIIAIGNGWVTLKSQTIDFVPASSLVHVTKPMRILHVLLSKTFGGIHQQTLFAYKKLYDNGYDAFMLIPNNSKIEEQLKKTSFCYYKCDVLNDLRSLSEGVIYPLPKDYCQHLYDILFLICKKHHIDIIHCHKPWEYYVAQKVAHNLGIRVIAHYHTHIVPDPKMFKDFDAFIGSSPAIVDFMKAANGKELLHIKQVEFIHPPHDEEKFLNFVPSLSKEAFFKKNFDITIKDIPIVCMIGNLAAYKNHVTLFQAIHELIYTHNIPVQLVLAGFGMLEKDLMRLVRKLKIQDYVYFLGFTQLIPELLYHSDMKILPSSGEAFGIVLLEAALMQKPIILSSAAAVANVLIKHGETGFLCDPNNSSDIALQIKTVIQNKEFSKKIAKDAYALVREKFSAMNAFSKTEELYRNIYT